MRIKRNKKTVKKIERYHPDVNQGLTAEQVKERFEDGYANRVEKKYSKSILGIFASNILTLFNLLGLIVFIGLVLVKADIMNFVFVIVYLVNITIGIIQELKAKYCIDKLSLISSKHSTVIRDGVKKEVQSANIVLDDIIILGLGNQVPTDCLILEGETEVNEALLTGESVPVKKTAGDELLSGSYITGGTCTVQAIKVGKHNYISKLAAKAKKYKKPQSELIGSLKMIIKILSFVIIPIGALFFIKSTILPDAPFSELVSDAILRTSAVIIGMIPSGLMLLTSLALAVGIIKLAKHNTLVQDLYSLEMLARVDTICFDKTGTITDGRMTVKEVVPLTEEQNYDANKIIGSMLGCLKDNNQTAIALFNYFGENSTYKSVATIPFNSIRKLSAVSFENMGTFALGAPEFVLSKEDYADIKSLINQYAGLGFRVLLLAHSDEYIKEEIAPHDFLPYALILIVDNIREDAAETIKWFKDNGVAIKVISGDNPLTVSEVSKRVGVENADKYISLEGLTNNEVYEIANKYTVFGRVSPEQKAILVKALKYSGHVTAMTGDGVNDILALKEADCAITVAAGSDAVKSIAHIVLLDNNFDSMPKVVYEGRRVINNVQNSASLYLMKTMFTILVAIFTLILPWIKTYPFKLNQMNLLEILVIGIPTFFLSLQPNDSKIEGKFLSVVMSKSLPSAVLMFLSAAAVELFRKTLATFDDSVYSTLAVYAITYSGMISLYEISLPLNKYRRVLVLSVLTILLGITIFSVINGFNALSLVKLVPLKTFWHHDLIVITIILLNLMLWSSIQKIFSKVKFKEIKKK